MFCAYCFFSLSQHYLLQSFTIYLDIFLVVLVCIVSLRGSPWNTLLNVISDVKTVRSFIDRWACDWEARRRWIIQKIKRPEKSHCKIVIMITSVRLIIIWRIFSFCWWGRPTASRPGTSVLCGDCSRAFILSAPRLTAVHSGNALPYGNTHTNAIKYI